MRQRLPLATELDLAKLRRSVYVAIGAAAAVAVANAVGQLYAANLVQTLADVSSESDLSDSLLHLKSLLRKSAFFLGSSVGLLAMAAFYVRRLLRES